MKIYRTCKKQNSFFFFYQNFHRKSTFYNINVSLPISCKEDYPYSTITIKAQMLEGRYKNSEGNLGDGGGTTEGRRNRKTRKKKKNWTSRKKEANCVKTFLFLFCFFFFFLLFFSPRALDIIPRVDIWS